ncbi:hypothetical protein [Natronococcus roseus]
MSYGSSTAARRSVPLLFLAVLTVSLALLGYFGLVSLLLEYSHP